MALKEAVMADEKTVFTSKIVTAYLGGNAIAVADIPDLIRVIYKALVGVSSPISEPAEPQQPFVQVKKSVTPDAIICLECGKKFSMLKRHLRTDHSMSTDEYRAKWGLPPTYPMVAPEYAERRSALAMKIGLGQKRKEGVVVTASVPEEAETVAATAKPQHQYPPSRWSRSSD
jgi:predicted transcriptional regulator